MSTQDMKWWAEAFNTLGPAIAGSIFLLLLFSGVGGLIIYVMTWAYIERRTQWMALKRDEFLLQVAQHEYYDARGSKDGQTNHDNHDRDL